MESWLDWARGPAFWTAFTFMVLGLARHAGLMIWEVIRAIRRAGDQKIPYGDLLLSTIKWMVPLGKMRSRWYYSLGTLGFHVSVILVPVFLAGHIALWKRGVGVSWPAIPNILADVLTITAIFTALLIVIFRALPRDSRALSRFQDYALPLAISVPFTSGFLMMHPALNPLAFETMFFIHVLSANLVLLLVPLTKVRHCLLLPFTQLVSEVAWHFTPDAGSRVGKALGKEGEPI